MYALGGKPQTSTGSVSIHHKRRVPHPFDIVSSNGWESTNLNRSIGDGPTASDLEDHKPGAPGLDSQTRETTHLSQRRVPLDKVEGFVKHSFGRTNPVRCVSTADFAREVEDQSSGSIHAASP
jgi:hypothetical protein